MTHIPNDCVLIVVCDPTLTRPWGCGRLSDLRPRLVVTGAPTIASEFFGRHTPVEMVLNRPGDSAALVAYALTKPGPVCVLVLGEDEQMVSLCEANGLHLTVLKQLPLDITQWPEQLTEELYSISGQYINDRIKSLSDTITDDLRQRADLFAEGVIRSEYAWR